MSLKTKQHFIYDQPYQLIIDIVTTLTLFLLSRTLASSYWLVRNVRLAWMRLSLERRKRQRLNRLNLARIRRLQGFWFIDCRKATRPRNVNSSLRDFRYWRVSIIRYQYVLPRPWSSIRALSSSSSRYIFRIHSIHGVLVRICHYSMVRWQYFDNSSWLC